MEKSEMRLRLRVWLFTGVLAVIGMAGAMMPARAAILTYSYTYTATTVGTITGTVEVDDITNLIVSITGSATSIGTITGLLAAGSLGDNDNILNSASPYLTLNGVSFSTTLYDSVNIFYSGGTYIAVLTSGGSDYVTKNGTLTLSRISAVPEPASLALLLSGLAGIGLVKRRARRGTAPAG
jgi:hypothetical protein